MPFTPIDAIEAVRACCEAAIVALEEEINIVEEAQKLRMNRQYSETIRQIEAERAHNVEAAIRENQLLTGNETLVAHARFLIAMCQDITYEVPEDGPRMIAFLRSASELLLMELNKRLVMGRAATVL